MVAALSKPFTTSVVRKRKRYSTAEVKGFITRLPANTASTNSPASKALRPNPIWNNSGSKKGTAPMAIRNSVPPQIVTA
ncbi:hypothetical protein D3C71_2016160 [compost metagenome]